MPSHGFQGPQNLALATSLTLSHNSLTLVILFQCNLRAIPHLIAPQAPNSVRHMCLVTGREKSIFISSTILLRPCITNI